MHLLLLHATRQSYYSVTWCLWEYLFKNSKGHSCDGVHTVCNSNSHINTIMLICKLPEGLRYTNLFLLRPQLICRVLSGTWGEISWAVVLEHEQRIG